MPSTVKTLIAMGTMMGTYEDDYDIACEEDDVVSGGEIKPSTGSSRVVLAYRAIGIR